MYVLFSLGFVLLLTLTLPALTIWAERRQSAMIQSRIGPVRAGFSVGGYSSHSKHLSSPSLFFGRTRL